MNNIKISIITASYNYADYIKETIESVINQTYQNWEMIIVDDGSKDNSIDIINEYTKKDSRIKLYTHEQNKNKGLIETIRLALTKAKGEYVVFLESDDFLSKEYIEKKINILQCNQEVGLIYNDIELIGERSTLTNTEEYLQKIRNYWLSKRTHNIGNILHYRNIVPTFSCVMVKTDLLQRCSFDSPKKAWIDWWLWAQISAKADFYYIPEKLTYWRMHDNSFLCNDVESIEYKRSVYNFYLKLYKVLPPIQGISEKIKFCINKFLKMIKYNYYI